MRLFSRSHYRTLAFVVTLSLALVIAIFTNAVRLGAAPNAEPVHITVGYQPYYAGAWSALVIKQQELWKKYLPPGSTVDWEVGLQGAVITNNMIAGKYQFGYVGDMPGIVATTKRSQADIRMIALTSFNNQQCNNFVVRADAPPFKTPQEAIKWMDGKRVAVPKGSCADRFAQAVFKRENVKPAELLNQSIEVITTNLRAGNLDAAVIWEPNVAHVGSVIGNKSARQVATGADWGESDTGEVIVTKDFMDKNPAAVVGMLKAEIEAQRFIVTNYPKNACALAGYAVDNATGFEKNQMWYALYGRPASSKPGQHDVRFSAHLVFDAPVRTFLDNASKFLVDAKVIGEPMPADAIVDGPLKQAMREMKVNGPLGDASVHPASDYPCG
ncbi:MAG: ABC transporter substrate-binding protein [Candidatus Eremiobacteraeota bacterium]|nr:ABC transporter substrate-binding protein [Candidatus Eremiobacteraeota bacterium]